MAQQLFLHLDSSISFPEKLPGSAVKWGSEDQSKLTSATDNTFEQVWISTPKPFGTPYMANLLRTMSPNATVTMCTSGDLPAVERSLLFGGFTDIKTDEAKKSVSAKKPAFKLGAAKKFKKTVAPKEDTARIRQEEKKKASVWALGDDDLAEEDVELEDEDSLLDREVDKVDIAAPTNVKDKNSKDCGTGPGGKRKACKDCTCGLKEEQEIDPNAEPKSACGNCGLGDAFRCSTCPYLGKPAFTSKDNVVKLVL